MLPIVNVTIRFDSINIISSALLSLCGRQVLDLPLDLVVVGGEASRIGLCSLQLLFMPGGGRRGEPQQSFEPRARDRE